MNEFLNEMMEGNTLLSEIIACGQRRDFTPPETIMSGTERKIGMMSDYHKAIYTIMHRREKLLAEKRQDLSKVIRSDGDVMVILANPQADIASKIIQILAMTPDLLDKKEIYGILVDIHRLGSEKDSLKKMLTSALLKAFPPSTEQSCLCRDVRAGWRVIAVHGGENLTHLN